MVNIDIYILFYVLIRRNARHLYLWCRCVLNNDRTSNRDLNPVRRCRGGAASVDTRHPATANHATAAVRSPHF